ncbi:sulfite reductase [Paraflavitalea soli]|uniref:assimilatory sulfite reductase (NADPH) n=1 Tax=Paraflavitalea soli TaxID=2315862 RepID=A0A3B7MPN5_9BACT|nr:flavodoxin domain-containing protein [Paraflavitalea soli]AXY76118.1 sulfite reductase [Paraflavitalea soli]
MLVEPKLKSLLELVNTSSREELIWMNGYLAGLLAQTQPVQQAAPVAVAAEVKPAVQKITIAYGTETGNSKKLATDFASQAKKSGINAKIVSLDQYRLNDLSKEEYFFTIISTQGEGEPPATAKKFYDHIHQNGFKLNQLKFGVLALGDTSYPLFCKAGEDVDSQLQKLGGQRIVSLQCCDTDYQSEASSWFSNVLTQLTTAGSSAPAQTAGTPVAKKTTGKKIYKGTVLTNINLNDRGSSKETYHIEIGVDEEVDYQPGDSIGIIPENPKQVVDTILALAFSNNGTPITFRNETDSIFNHLKKRINVAWLPERVVKQYAAIIKQDIPETKIGLVDLLKIYPVKDVQQFHEVVAILEPITPRLYSISSSPSAHSGEVHITVARDTFYINQEAKYGLCSDFLSQHLSPDSEIEFYVHKNNQFRLPEANKDVIMIGPGTGIAPFRSFLAERDATGAEGRNWLFFGDQHFVTDFLYQTEIQNWLQTGALTHVNLAFSRDQKFKIYVQHRILEKAAELWKWISSGAYIYICGAKEPMSVDVEYALLQVIQRYSGKTDEEAIQYLDQLKEEGRYLKDVY